MFRLTEQCGHGGLVLKLEGRCSSEVIGELDTCWRAARRKVGSAPIWVDLSEVSRIDASAQEQLTRMYHAGVRFVARGCLMREVIREISETR
jgi:anti-anti-sigma regulatory factor